MARWRWMFRFGITAVSGAAVAALSVVSAASAAVTLGQTGSPGAFCGSDNYIAQFSTAAGHPSYAVPSGFGVITSWSYQSSGMSAQTGKLIVWRPTGTANQFIYQDTSPLETFNPLAVSTLSARIPVQPNDVLGMVESNLCLLFLSSTSGDVATYVSSPSEPAKGSTQTLSGGPVDNEALGIAARVEADTDHDAFGDETQDNCVGTAGGFDGCPNLVTLDKVKQKGTKPKVRATVTVPGAGTLSAGSPTDPALASASANRLKTVTMTLTGKVKQQVVLTLKLTKSATGRLRQKGKLKVPVKAVYKPIGGPAGSSNAKAKLRG